MQNVPEALHQACKITVHIYGTERFMDSEAMQLGLHQDLDGLHGLIKHRSDVDDFRLEVDLPLGNPAYVEQVE